MASNEPFPIVRPVSKANQAKKLRNHARMTVSCTAPPIEEINYKILTGVPFSKPADDIRISLQLDLAKCSDNWAEFLANRKAFGKIISFLPRFRNDIARIKEGYDEVIEEIKNYTKNQKKAEYISSNSFKTEEASANSGFSRLNRRRDTYCHLISITKGDIAVIKSENSSLESQIIEIRSRILDMGEKMSFTSMSLDASRKSYEDEKAELSRSQKKLKGLEEEAIGTALKFEEVNKKLEETLRGAYEKSDKMKRLNSRKESQHRQMALLYDELERKRKTKDELEAELLTISEESSELRNALEMQQSLIWKADEIIRSFDSNKMPFKRKETIKA